MCQGECGGKYPFRVLLLVIVVCDVFPVGTFLADHVTSFRHADYPRCVLGPFSEHIHNPGLRTGLEAPLEMLALLSLLPCS